MKQKKLQCHGCAECRGFPGQKGMLEELHASKRSEREMFKRLSPFCGKATHYQKTRYCQNGDSGVYVKCTMKSCPLLGVKGGGA